MKSSSTPTERKQTINHSDNNRESRDKGKGGFGNLPLRMSILNPWYSPEYLQFFSLVVVMKEEVQHPYFPHQLLVSNYQDWFFVLPVFVFFFCEGQRSQQEQQSLQQWEQKQEWQRPKQPTICHLNKLKRKSTLNDVKFLLFEKVSYFDYRQSLQTHNVRQEKKVEVNDNKSNVPVVLTLLSISESESGAVGISENGLPKKIHENSFKNFELTGNYKSLNLPRQWRVRKRSECWWSWTERTWKERSRYGDRRRNWLREGWIGWW